MTLVEGHREKYGLNGPATKYLCDKFHDCRGQSVWENANV